MAAAITKCRLDLFTRPSTLKRRILLMYLDCFKKLKILDLSLIIIFVWIIGLVFFFFLSIIAICRGWDQDLPYENLMIFELRLNA